MIFSVNTYHRDTIYSVLESSQQAFGNPIAYFMRKQKLYHIAAGG